MIFRQLVFAIFFSFMLCGQACYATDYWCFYTNEKGWLVMGERFKPDQTAEQSCDWLNIPFFADSDPNGYSDCVKNYRFLENAYKNGDCKPILKQKHSSGDTTCTIEYYEEDSNTKKRLSSHCKGSDEAFIEKVKNMYE